jgi:3-hydroxybutyryl-CoA dehydrogenase
MEIRKVGVLGCGLMGSGIAQVSAQAGFATIVREVDEPLVKAGIGRIEGFLAKAVERGKATPEERARTIANLKGTTQLADLSDCDIVIEAIVEDLKVKRETFAALDGLLGPQAIIASNTSSLSVTRMMSATRRPERVIGLHFFNPVPLMKLVEVVKTVRTSPEVVETGMEFARKLGKDPILAKDSPGFVVNLLLVPYLLGAIRALEKGVASIEDIDKGMKLGTGYPMGPFTLLDFVGLDTTNYIAEIMFEEFKSPQYAAPTLLKRMVHAGYHGRKSGKGFYDYSQDPPRPTEGLL